MKFLLKNVDGDNYIHSDIDGGGGMSVVLSSKTHADRFDDPETAASLLRRCSERYPATRLEVVVEA